ncbi:DUF59 domain-containing protein [Candidatus Microgenomates bacterium]|nr:DUF59 domain-containing protein [Candidatus Microgenomates bacterium]
MLSRDLIMAKLKTVQDPELNINIVDLGLIYDVSVSPDPSKALRASPSKALRASPSKALRASKIVKVKMTLTSPGCPLSFVFDQLVTSAIKEIDGVKEVKVELTFEPPWSPAKMTEEAKLELGWIE